MPGLESIINDKIDRLEKIPDEFISVIDKQNLKLFKEALQIINVLEVEDGVILYNEKNLASLNRLSQIITDTLFGGEYLEGLKSYVSEFGTQAQLVNDIYSLQFDFEDKDLYRGAVSQAQRTALELFDERAITSNYVKPLKDMLTTNLQSGVTMSQMVENLRDFILGDGEKDPKLSSYATRIVRDTFSIFDNTYTQIIANDLKIEYFEYSGGLLQDSRDFCKQRAGKVFSKSEIQGWANLSWQGKNPATNSATIFAYRGGYNCIHSFIPVVKN